MGLNFDAGRMIKGLIEAEQKTAHALEVYGRTAAQRMERNIKRNPANGGAPWQDRTANARQSVAAITEWRDEKLVIGVSGNMEYSVYLEYCNGRKYAALEPELRRSAPEILSGLKGLI